MNDLEIIWKYKDFFIEGIGNTFLLSILSISIGVVFGVTLSLMRISGKKVLSTISKIYVELIRGTPLLIQIWIVYIAFDTQPFTGGLIALSLNSGAYVSEIIRSGIQSIELGQSEAARSLGFDKASTMKLIILPQAVKNITPVIGNEFIAIVKETSVVSAIGVGELMFNVNLVRGNSYNPEAPLLVAFVVYFIMTFLLSRGVKYLERRLQVSDRSN